MPLQRAVMAMSAALFSALQPAPSQTSIHLSSSSHVPAGLTPGTPSLSHISTLPASPLSSSSISKLSTPTNSLTAVSGGSGAAGAGAGAGAGATDVPPLTLPAVGLLPPSMHSIYA